ncbi:MAG: hypothetical protein ACI4JQ_04880 [Ruminococcus sp.]
MKTIKKLTASVLAVASAAAMTATMAPAFAYEDTAAAQAAFINSYANEKAKVIAAYCLEDGLSMEETASLLEDYLAVEEQNNGVSLASATSPDYYNNSALSGAPHRLAAIVRNTTVSLNELICFTFNRNVVSYAGSSSLCGIYNNSSTTLMTYNTPGDENSINSLLVSTTTSTTGAEVAIKYSLDVSGATSESNLYGSITMTDSSGHGYMEYATYVLGDVNHDGQVTDVDEHDVLEFIVELRDDFTYSYLDYKTYYAAVNMLAADANEDGIISMADVNKIKSWEE